MTEYGIYKTGIVWELLAGDNAYSFVSEQDLVTKMKELGLE